MRARILIALLALAGLPAMASAQEKPVLSVYTYASFTGKYGPGKAVKEAFEKDCACTLSFTAVDDGASMLSRLRLEGVTAKADVILGIDNALMHDLSATGLIAPHGLTLPALDLPIAWTSADFVPFDWGYFAFVYDSAKLADPPSSLAELARRRDVKIIIQDPRTSTPGLGLLTWMHAAFGPQAPEMWRQLKPNIVTVTKGWSEAYGLFLKGEADMVLSYTTSPAYHAGVEKKLNFKAASFAEGHLMQIEVAGILRTSKQPALARRFLEFMLTPAFQSLIPETNWMYPARAADGGLPASFSGVAKPGKTLSLDPAEISAGRRRWIDEWLLALAL